MEALLSRDIIHSKAASRLILLFTAILLTSFSGLVRIPLPFSPVPITLQTFFVLLSAALLGRNLAVGGQIGYIFLGLMGLPAFSLSLSGLAYLSGPTGGYILGFVLAALFVGQYINKADKPWKVFFILALGDAVIFICGLAWLKILLGYSLTKLLAIGVLPFIPADIFKIALAGFIYLKLSSRIKNIIRN